MESRRFLKLALVSLPLPWVAIEAGWFIAEYGRQPWAVEGVLPTFYAASDLSVTDLAISLGFFVTLYTVLAVIMVLLMLKVIKAGPSGHNLVMDAVSGAPVTPKGATATPDRH